MMKGCKRHTPIISNILKLLLLFVNDDICLRMPSNSMNTITKNSECVGFSSTIWCEKFFKEDVNNCRLHEISSYHIEIGKTDYSIFRNTEIVYRRSFNKYNNQTRVCFKFPYDLVHFSLAIEFAQRIFSCIVILFT